MGRHRADSASSRDDDGDHGTGEPGPGRNPAGSSPELLGWGVFLAAIAAAAMVWAGIDWPTTAGCALLLLVSFAAVWRVQRGTGRGLLPAAAPAPAPAATDTPASTEPAPITRRQMRAADPSTGLLPIIKASSGPVPRAPVQVLTGLNPIVPGGRRERRHTAGASSLPAPAAATAAAPAARVPAPAGTAASTAIPPQSRTAETDTAGESRWTRTFGPPETGQLPVQRYVAGPAGADPADPTDPDQPDRRQRSHSSL